MKMRRSTLTAAVLSLPLTTHALSFNSIQTITVSSLPAQCAAAYTSEIAACTIDDLNLGCTSQCKTALLNKANQVTTACGGLIVNSRSLLGIIQSGRVTTTLCVKDRDDATTTTARSVISIVTSRPIATSTNVVPPPILVDTSTTPRLIATSSPLQISSTTLAPSSTPTLPGNTLVPPTTLPPGGIIGDLPTQISSSAVSTTTRPVRVGDSVNNGSGGGSPFDVIAEGRGTLNQGSSLLSALVVMGWTLMVFGR